VHATSWLVQLTTCKKKRFNHWVRAYAYEFNGMPTTAHLNMLPLALYSIILGMDWFYLHSTKVDCFDKANEGLDDNGEKVV